MPPQRGFLDGIIAQVKGTVPLGDAVDQIWPARIGAGNQNISHVDLALNAHLALSIRVGCSTYNQPLMFYLTDAELERAKAAISAHGYSVYFPPPPEWDTTLAHWDAIRAHLIAQDLDIYRPQEPLRTYAPKSRINIRPVVLLHPYDLLIYTALTLLARDDIEAGRIPVAKKRVFSHRSTPDLLDALYEPSGAAHDAYRARQRARASRPSCKTVVVTDVADFFPRAYHHRLGNVIRSLASSPRVTEVARVLVDKLLFNLAEANSYGLPVGPLASSVLAEALLIDVDTALLDAGYDFVRWFDDYTFFCADEAEGQQALFFLGQWLHQHHGLTLQPAKTRILRQPSFLKGLSRDYEQRIKDRSEKLHAIWKEMMASEYGPPNALTPEQAEEVESLNLAGMLQEALTRDTKRGIDFEFAELIIGRLATASVLPRDQVLELVKIVIKRIPDLYPIISSVSTFFTALSGLRPADHKRIAEALLEPLTRTPAPPDFVAMWILHVFASSDAWNHAQALRGIYESARSPVVKRYAALALAMNGTRSHALTTRSDLVGARPLVRTAILRAWHKVGADERGHWKKHNVIADPLERAI